MSFSEVSYRYLRSTNWSCDINRTPHNPLFTQPCRTLSSRIEYTISRRHIPLTRSAVACSGPSVTNLQSRTPPFQSAIRPSLTRTVTTRASSSIERLGRLNPACCCCCWCWSIKLISSSNVLFSRCLSLHQDSSCEPGSRKRALPVMVVEILDKALELRFRSRLARDERVAAGGGEPSRSPGFGPRVGGRWDTQS